MTEAAGHRPPADGRGARQLDLFAPPDGGRPRRQPPTLAAVATEYLVHLAHLGKARHTLDATSRDVDQLCSTLGERAIDQVGSGELARFVEQLASERGNSVASLRRKIATIKALFRFARRAEHRRDDPSAGIPYPPLEEREVEPLPSSQAERLVDSAPTRAHRALLLLMLDAGLKREEVLAVQAGDVSREPEGGTLVISRALAAKRARARAIPLSPRLARALGELLRDRDPHEPLLELSTRGVDFVVREAGRREGIPDRGTLTPQRLRDTYAVNWLESRIARELAESDPDGRRRLEAQHDLELAALLGLKPGSLAIARYRRAARRLQHDQAEAPFLPNP